jgi:hypothetical protein
VVVDDEQVVVDYERVVVDENARNGRMCDICFSIVLE